MRWLVVAFLAGTAGGAGPAGGAAGGPAPLTLEVSVGEALGTLLPSQAAATHEVFVAVRNRSGAAVTFDAYDLQRKLRFIALSPATAAGQPGRGLVPPARFDSAPPRPKATDYVLLPPGATAKFGPLPFRLTRVGSARLQPVYTNGLERSIPAAWHGRLEADEIEVSARAFGGEAQHGVVLGLGVGLTAPGPVHEKMTSSLELRSTPQSKLRLELAFTNATERGLCVDTRSFWENVRIEVDGPVRTVLTRTRAPPPRGLESARDSIFVEASSAFVTHAAAFPDDFARPDFSFKIPGSYTLRAVFEDRGPGNSDKHGTRGTCAMPTWKGVLVSNAFRLEVVGER